MLPQSHSVCLSQAPTMSLVLADNYSQAVDRVQRFELSRVICIRRLFAISMRGNALRKEVGARQKRKGSAQMITLGPGFPCIVDLPELLSTTRCMLSKSQ